METKVKNRGWVKDAAIVFLAVLLVLTFFSNTIMNRTLPEVATEGVHEGAIIAKVRGTGTVTATGKHQVKAKETRTIRSVMVKVGQEVKAGDVLFVLGEGDETELEQAKERLRNLQTSYQKTALSTPIYDYSSYNRAIETAQNNYNRAWDDYVEAQNKADAVDNPVTSAAKARYEAAKQKAEELEKNYDQQKEEEKRALISLLEVLYAQKEEMQPAAEAAAEAATQNEKNAWIQAENDYTAAQKNAELADESRQEAQDQYELVLKDVDAATEDVFNQLYAELEARQTAYETALSNANQAREDADAAESTYRTAYDNALSEAYRQIETEIENKEQELAAIEQDQTAHYEEVRKAIEERDKLYDEYLDQIGSAAQDLKSAEYAVQDAEIALQAAYDSLNTAQENNNRSAAQTGVELQSIAEEIRLQQEKIKSLAGDESNTVLADVPGTVSTVDCTAGDTVLKNALMATLEVPDMGYTLSFSVTNDQAQRLRVGDTATVSNYYWGNSVIATLTTIRTDPKNPQGGKVLVFDLTGDVVAGSELSISVGQKSANYDLVVPNSAVKSDSNGSFVLAVAVKSSPLGNRYTARRVSVEVRANDDNNSAVVGDLSNGDYVITTSSAPIKSGDMVRLADSD